MFVTFSMLGHFGRFGNQLFQIAATIGVARKHGMEFVFPPWAYVEYFRHWIPQSIRIPKVQQIRELEFCYNEISLSASADLFGCFQSERYFKHCEDEVRSYLQPNNDILTYLKSKYGQVLAGNTCSLHVRRGDFVGHPQYANLGITDYYEKAITLFEPNTTFLVFSDDILWCQRRFTGRNFVFADGQTHLADLVLMSLCRDHIIANSSFSWWGAWLDSKKDKRVIAPGTWFVGDYANPTIPFSATPPYHGYHNTKDLIPAEWILVHPSRPPSSC